MQNQKSQQTIKCLRIYIEKPFFFHHLLINIFCGVKTTWFWQKPEGYKRWERSHATGMNHCWSEQKSIPVTNLTFFFFSQKHRLYGWKLPNQRDVNSKVIHCAIPIRFKIGIVFLLFSWKIHYKHESITFLKLFPPEIGLHIPIFHTMVDLII